jgi:cell division protein FtsQ
VLGGAAALAGVLAMAWVAQGSPLLDVDRVEVLGSSQVPPERAATAAEVDRGKPIMAVDPSRGAARLEALPWVRRAEVRRLFPNRVRIWLEERRAAAWMVHPAGGFAVLDETGRVLAEATERPEGLPEVTGLGPAPAPGQWLPEARPVLRTVAALPDGLRRQVRAAGVAASGVTLRLASVPEVRFGAPRELAAKAAALASLLERLGGRPVAFVDVQVASAPVVAPAPAPAVPKPSGSRSATPSGGSSGARR